MNEMQRRNRRFVWIEVDGIGTPARDLERSDSGELSRVRKRVKRFMQSDASWVDFPSSVV